MPNFIFDSSSVNFPKTDLNPLPGGADPTKYVAAVDWNSTNQAVVDIRSALTGLATGSINIQGAITGGLDLTLTRNLNVGAAITGANVTVVGSLTSSGNSIFNGTLTVNGGITSINNANSFDATSFTSNAYGAGDNSYFGWDAQAAARVGFVKKAGVQGKLAYGNTLPFVITMANGSSSIANPAGTTFTDQVTIDTNGGVTAAGSITGSGDGTFSRNLNVASQLTVSGGAIVTGSITGSGDVTIGSTAGGLSNSAVIRLQSRPITGLQDAVVVSPFVQNTANDGQRIRFQWNNEGVYNAWIAARLNNTSPAFLDPRLEFGIQQAGTLGVTNVTASLIVNNYGIQVTGSVGATAALSGAALLLTGTLSSVVQALVVRSGSSGVTTWLPALARFEGAETAYVDFAAPANQPKGLVFSNAANNADGWILYDQTSRAVTLAAQGSIRTTIDGTGKLTQAGDISAAGSITGSGGAIIHAGNSGLSSNAGAALIIDSSTSPIISFTGPNGNQKGIFFANGYSNIDGAILYDDNGGGFYRGMEFKVGGFVSALTITSSGSVNVIGSLTGSGDGLFSRNLVLPNGGLYVTGSVSLTGTFVHTPNSGKIGFFGTSPVLLQTVTGSRSTNPGVNGAIVGILNALAAYGIIINNTST